MKPWNKEHPCNRCFIWNLRWSLFFSGFNKFMRLYIELLVNSVTGAWKINFGMLKVARKEYVLGQRACSIQVVSAFALCANKFSIFGWYIYIYIVYLLLKWLYGSQSRVSDLDLDEGEVLKLASFGNGANNKDTIDILRKSLVMRNR